MVVRRSILSLALCALAGVPALGQAAFSDRTVASGLSHTTSLPFDMTQRQMYCGGSVGDFNNDGWPDLFLLGGGDNATADKLFLNNGDGTFTDHAVAYGVAKIHRGRGTTVGDFNNDGWDDIFVTSGGDMTDGDRVGQHVLYRNNGDGTFTDIAVAAGVNQSSFAILTATGAAFGDYDLDGDLDLYVCGWEGFDSNRLYRNNGDETFTDATGNGLGQAHYGFSPRFVDMNGDRYPEILVAADFWSSKYYVNDGDGTFTLNNTTGVGLESNGMGNTVADFNRDGLPDWYVTSIYADTNPDQDGNYLYVNQGNDTYTFVPEVDGARNGGWGWGTEALDIDHDGWTDIVETNGWMPTEWSTENSYLWRNNGDLTFTEVQGAGTMFQHVSQGRGLLLIDYDRDADMDIVLTGWDEPVALFRNDISGPDTNSIEIELDTSMSATLAPDGYGSKITITAGGVTQYAWPNGGSTYLGRSQMITHFGIGAATSVDITVEWQDGTTTTATGVAANQIVTLSPAAGGSAPGESSDGAGENAMMSAARNDASGMIDVTFTPACDASGHTIYYGDLADVSSYTYSGAACWRGNTGITSFDPAGLESAFFLVVGNNGVVEGSYGRDHSGLERPQDTTAACQLPQDLSGTCSLP